MKKLCALLHVYNSFPSKMTPRWLILMKAFWFCGRFPEAMSFSRFATSKWRFDTKQSKVWKWNCLRENVFLESKGKIINLVVILREKDLLIIIDPYLKHDFWYKRSKVWKWRCLRKMALESKCLHQNQSWLNGVILREKECSSSLMYITNVI